MVPPQKDGWLLVTSLRATMLGNSLAVADCPLAILEVADQPQLQFCLAVVRVHLKEPPLVPVEMYAKTSSVNRDSREKVPVPQKFSAPRIRRSPSVSSQKLSVLHWPLFCGKEESLLSYFHYSSRLSQ